MSVEFNSDSHSLVDSTSNNVTSAAHGLMVKLSGTSTTVFGGLGSYIDILEQEKQSIHRKFSTGNSTDSQLWGTSSTNWNAAAVATSHFYPVLEIAIPQWVEQSKVGVVLVVAACSSDIDYAADINCGFYLMSGRGKMGAYGHPMPASTLYYQIPGMISYYPVDSGTSGVDTLTTELSINGGEVFTLYALSTDANQIMLQSMKFTGLSTDVTFPNGTTFGNIQLSTNL